MAGGSTTRGPRGLGTRVSRFATQIWGDKRGTPRISEDSSSETCVISGARRSAVVCGHDTPRQGLLRSARRRCARAAARDPGPTEPRHPLLRPGQREDGRQGARHGRHGRRAARQPRGRGQGGEQGEVAPGPRRHRQGDRLRTDAVLDPDQLARQPVGARRPHHPGARDRRQARRDHGAEGAGRRGHPLRRPPARPARGEGRPRPADPRARDPGDRPRRGQHRGDLRGQPAHAGPLARPCRPGRRPPDEDHARRRRPPRLPRPAGPGARRPRRAAVRRPADVVPAGPVALHDRPDGRRVRDARHLPLLRARSATSRTPSRARTSSATRSSSAASAPGACTRRRSRSPTRSSPPASRTSPTPVG